MKTRNIRNRRSPDVSPEAVGWNDEILMMKTSSQSWVIVLPTVAALRGKFDFAPFVIYDAENNAATNNITIQASGTDLINGESSVTINTNGGGGIFKPCPTGYIFIGTGQQNTSPPVTGSYEKYTALLTQAGSANPVATVLESGVGTIVWTRTGEGATATGTLAGAFPAARTALSPVCRKSPNTPVSMTRVNDNSVVIEVGADDLLVGSLVEIKVFSS